MADEKDRRAADEPRGFVAEWALRIVILVFGTTTLLQAFVVPTGSMEGSILIGDYLIVDKLAYAPSSGFGSGLLPYREVKRGDVIVFRWPPDPNQTYVKRVIGVPGDRIKLVNKEVYRNGRKLTEPYARHITPYFESYRDSFPATPTTMLDPRGWRMLTENVVNGELVVPPGQYFALGDNRDNSLDSRYWGLVPRENIIGKPLIIFWSYDAPTKALVDSNPVNPDHLLDIAQHFFTKTRWRRTLMLVRAYPEM